jgi:fatty acid desaturase
MKFSKPLPPAVLGDKRALSVVGRKQLDALNGPSPKAFIFQLLQAWLVIFSAIAVAVYVNNILISLAAIFIVATRQNVLGLLIHEQAHCLGFKAKPGDLLVNLFAAYPLLIMTVEGYSKVHLAHHRFYFEDNDPDLQRKSGPEWTFPMPRNQLLQLFAKDVFGLNLVALIKGKKAGKERTQFNRPWLTPAWVRSGFYLVVVSLLTWSGTWSIFLLYWLLPLVSVFQVIVRIGALCEHQYIPNASVLDSSPIIELYWWENMLLPNLNFNLHTYHHFCPGIAFNNLPKAHAIFRREGLIDEANVFKGYGAYFKYLVDSDPKQDLVEVSANNQ